jgi:hypothetical protein
MVGSRPNIDGVFSAHESDCTSDPRTQIRTAAVAEESGQREWLTVEGCDLFIERLNLGSNEHLVDIACGPIGS